jgi:hypothetical protein
MTEYVTEICMQKVMFTLSLFHFVYESTTEYQEETYYGILIVLETKINVNNIVLSFTEWVSISLFKKDLVRGLETFYIHRAWTMNGIYIYIEREREKERDRERERATAPQSYKKARSQVSFYTTPSVAMVVGELGNAVDVIASTEWEGFGLLLHLFGAFWNTWQP